MTIGAHTVNHLALTHQTDDIVVSEARENRSALELVVGRSITQFAYPYGAVDHRVAECLRREYRWCVTCDAVGVPSSFDTTRVPRVEIKDGGVDSFRARLEAALGDRSATGARWLL
jgi:peptidoglycan/xylan/chitin deacetylase (PgdA/CDA1 family)